MKRNVAMISNFPSSSDENFWLDPDFWQEHNFPIIYARPLEKKETKANFKNYTKIYVDTIGYRDPLVFTVSLEQWKEQSCDIIFFVNTKDEKMINQFKQEIERIFENMTHKIKACGWEFDQETFWEETKDPHLNGKIKDSYLQNLIKSKLTEAIPSWNSKKALYKLNTTLSDLVIQTTIDVDEMIKNRNIKFYQKYKYEVNNYYQEKQTEAYEYPDYEDTNLYSLEKKLDIQNKTNKI